MTEKNGIERCESPMEVAFAEALSRCGKWQWRERDWAAYEVGSWPGWAMVLLAQLPMAEYRADFVITSIDSDANESGTIPWMVLIEIDGHDFHERTKEQARRDRSRDRFFTERGARVLRFTGSEIYADADACAQQAWWIAAELQRERFDRTFNEHLIEAVMDMWDCFEYVLDWVFPGRGGFSKHTELRPLFMAELRQQAPVRKARGGPT